MQSRTRAFIAVALCVLVAAGSAFATGALKL